MLSFPRRHAAVAASVIFGVLAMAGSAQAAILRLDLAVATSALQFQPPATLPDIGAATIRVTNVGILRPSAAIVEVDTVSRLSRVTANGVACQVVSAGETDVARCAVAAAAIPAPWRSHYLAVTVEISSPPGNCSCVPFTVRLSVPGDGNLANNVATATIVR